MQKRNYKDITNKILKCPNKNYKIIEQQFFIDNNGNTYNVDGKYVVLSPSKREKEVAILLGKIYGGNILIIPRVNEPPSIKTPDYIINGESFDLKGIKGNGKNTLDNSIRKQEKQSSNFIFDLTNATMNIDNVIQQVQNIYNSEHRYWVNKIILIENDNILKIYTRNN